MDLRRLQAGDSFDGLIRLSREFFEEYQSYHPEFFGIDALHDEDVIGYFSEFLSRDDRAAFIASSNGEVTGYITVVVETQPVYWRVKKAGHISGLMVSKASRRKGVGTRLLEETRTYLRDHGITHYTVSTAVANRQALAFYAERALEPLRTVLLGKTQDDAWCHYGREC